MEVVKDEIVISGISGRFPESNNMKEFMENLLGNKNMVTCSNERFQAGLFDLPHGFGKLKEIDKFDAEPFGIVPKQVDGTDPQARIALETTYEALVDAGINPNSTNGKKTGVFSAVMFHDALSIVSAHPSRIKGQASVNMLGALIPNRISYIFNWNGPSANYDTACSSSIFALEAAVRAIENGKCDDAIIVASTLILNPVHSLFYKEAGMLAQDYTTRAFDSSGLGFVRAEAVVSIYIQKKSLALRSYFAILGIGSNNDGYKEEGNSYPSAYMQEELLNEVYSDANINPADVTYIEAHGTGTPAGDPTEIKAISRVFCMHKNREKPLLIGSVKSNMGHAESCSGLCSIAKLIVICQTGIIPANLNFTKPHFQSNFIRYNKIKVVTENTKWEGGLMGLNSFGYGGVNTHVILKPNIQDQICLPSNEDIVLFSGRTELGVKSSIEEILESSDVNSLYMVNNVNKKSTNGEIFRGFGIKSENNFIEIGNVRKNDSSLWFVFNGMGSQWVGMGQSLLQTLPTFRESFYKSCKALEPFNYDLEKVFNSSDPNIFTNSPTNSFVCIGVIQIGLLDVLSELGLNPDGLIGHSCGEHICAYADDCLSREQTIVSLYLRGQACDGFVNNETEYGMAAVNMAFEQVKEICPDGLYPVCNNGPKSTTIAGPIELIQKFKIQLGNISSDLNIKEVQSAGMPFHSPYLGKCSDMYMEYLKHKMSIELKVRSRKWISTSEPEDEWSLLINKLFTVEYLYKNYSSPVLFLPALNRIPSNSTIIEIGPSGLLRGLIQRGTKDCSVFSLQTRNENNCLIALKQALGRIFISGINLDINKLANYKNIVNTPVPGNTPSIGHLVDWDHSVTWAVPNYKKIIGKFGSTYVSVDITNPDDAFLVGHTIQGRVLYPSTGYVYIVWKLFAQMKCTPMNQLSVIFENVKIQRVTLLRQNEVPEFFINISDTSGYFELNENDTVVCCGTIRTASEKEAKLLNSEIENHENLNQFVGLTRNEIYTKLRLLGCEYQGVFKGILECNLEGTKFKVEWNDNWIAFLDTFLQPYLRVYSEKDLLRDLRVPTEIPKLLIDPTKFYEVVESGENSGVVDVQYNPFTRICRCKGIEAEGIKLTSLSKNIRAEKSPVITNHAFEPYDYKETGLEITDEEYSPLLRSVAIVVQNMDFVYDKTIHRKPNILEISIEPSITETVETNKLLRVHFAIQEINYTFCSEDLWVILSRSETHSERENITLYFTVSIYSPKQ